MALKEVNHGQYVKTSPTSQVVNFILKISSSLSVVKLHFTPFQELRTIIVHDFNVFSVLHVIGSFINEFTKDLCSMIIHQVITVNADAR